MSARRAVAVPLAAFASWALAGVAGGLAVDGYSHLRHPLALLGAHQLLGAPFNLFAFVLPGLAGVWVALRLRDGLPAATTPKAAGIGGWLVLLAALGFVAQGLLPLDLDRLDGGGSRWHATAWLLWALAFPVGAGLLGGGLWNAPGARRLALASLAAGALVLACGFLGSGWVGAGIAQRLAFAAWLAWQLPTAAGLSRGAA